MSDLSNINVAILAGGLGTRLQPKFAGKPKVLAPIGNRPFLTYVLDQLDNAGFKKVILCTCYLSEQIEKTFGNQYKGLQIEYSIEQTPLGSGGAIRNALSLLNSEIVMIMNGDSYVTLEFAKFYNFQIGRAHV